MMEPFVWGIVLGVLACSAFLMARKPGPKGWKFGVVCFAAVLVGMFLLTLITGHQVSDPPVVRNWIVR